MTYSILRTIPLINPGWLYPEPRSLISSVQSTQLGHCGQRKTEAAIRKRFWWPLLHEDVIDFCHSCTGCARIKEPIPTARAPLQPIAVEGPNHRIGVDIMGPLPTTHAGNRYILVMVDYFTKWCEAVPLKQQDAQSVASAIVNEWICRYGAPVIIHSDRGSAFENHLLNAICNLLQIKKTRTTPYHPEGNGLVERTNRTLKQKLLAMIEHFNSNKWDDYLPRCLLAYRASIHDSTGYAPSCLQLGRELRLPVELQSPILPTEAANQERYVQDLRKVFLVAYRITNDNIGHAQQHQKSYYDRKSLGPSYSVGDHVYLYRPKPPPGTAAKFHRTWQGPYVIVYQPSTVTFVLRDPFNHQADVFTVHYNQLKPANTPPNKNLGFSVPDVDNVVEVPSHGGLSQPLMDTGDSVPTEGEAM